MGILANSERIIGNRYENLRIESYACAIIGVDIKGGGGGACPQN